MDNFSVKLLYKVVVGSNSVAFPHQLIWSTRFPPRWVFFFAWEDSWGKGLTLDQLKSGKELYVSFVGRMKRRLIICYYIVLWLDCYGIFS